MIRLLLVLFVALLGTTAFVNQYRKQEGMRSAIKQARDAWVRQDAEALAQLFTPDGELIVPGSRWRGQTQIRAEVSRFAQQYSEVQIDIQRIILAEDSAVVEWHYEDTEQATGRRNKADDAIVVDFKDGRIERWREYFDTQPPSPPQPSLTPP